ncbi:MAG: replication-relaxation family protein [Rhizobiales bacterium]|nr:replication-relaxation family protein [Hyphomicrobiales bacterium]
MHLIKMVEGRALDYLARYRFLTVSQLVRLGAGDEKNLRKRLKELETAGLIRLQEFRLGPSSGRLPNAHWLTAKGARLVSEANREQVEAPRVRGIKEKHWWHRMLTVDALIAADRWAATSNKESVGFQTYMQWKDTKPITGLDLGSKAAIADAIFRATDTAGNHRVYVIEVYCSRYSEGVSSHPLEQMEPYVLAGDQVDVSLNLGADDKAARVLIVCDTSDLRDRILRVMPQRKGMPPSSSPTWGRFLLKAADELRDFGTGWHQFGEGLRDLPT